MTTDDPLDPHPETADGATVERVDVAWRRRLMVFGESIRSDMDNPQATTWRSIMRSLTRSGHEVVFIEPRRSDSLTQLLRHRGSAPLRQFGEVYPDLQYRTLDLPRGRELSLWLARELALVDAVVVLDNASSEIKALVAAYDEPRLVRFQSVGPDRPVDEDGDFSAAGPAIDIHAVDPHPIADPNRPRLAVLAWDAEQASLATQVWHSVRTLDAGATQLSLGSLALDGWQPITALDLPTALSRTDLAVVIARTHPADRDLDVRSLQPWSLGVRTMTVATGIEAFRNSLPGSVVSIDAFPDGIRELARAGWPDLTPWSADRRAAQLLAAIDRRRAALRVERS